MRITNLCKSYDTTTQVFDNFSLDVETGSILCITGPSGCGKTTLLDIIAGLQEKDAGEIHMDDQEAGNSVSYLFQEPRLFGWRTVLENVELPLKNVVNAHEEAMEVLSLVGLEEAADRYPGQLSGGMRQRTAIARAFCFPSRLILMDEPFQSLDVGLRDSLRNAFLKIWEKKKKTVLWVTHDIAEAALAADNILCLSQRPAKEKSLERITIPRDLRTAENTVDIQARIYKTLTKVE